MAATAESIHNVHTRHYKAWHALGYVVATAMSSTATSDPTISAGAGAAGESEPNGSIWMRSNGVPEYRVGGAWQAFALLGTAQDWSATVTAADELANFDLSVNHATAQGIGVDGSAIQLTARSSGIMAGVAGTTTSLAGDSGGTYASLWARPPTDGGGSATHVALLIGAGHDIAIDASGAATGEADVLLGANLASAWQFRSAADATFLTMATTTATPSMDLVSTSTGANQLLTSSLSLNHASNAGSAIQGSATQLTARSSGILSAVAGTTTSLAGDSGGTYAAFEAKAPTDGGGSATHVGFYLAAGHDMWADLSAAATGEADVLVGANLASALQIRSAADAALFTVSTATATPSVDLVSTSTGANQLLTSTLSLNHASNAGSAISGSAVQLTARASGVLSAVRGTCTSLAGDSGGTYASFEAAAHTDGGGSATHVGYYQAAGLDAFADLSACGTGEADVILGANLASALQIRSAADATLYTVATSTATPNAAYVSTSTGVNPGLLRSTLSLNHASNAGSAIQGSATQLTARSSGILAGVTGTTTSLAGDSGGTYAALQAAAPTDGGGSATHVGLYVAAGHDAAIDLSACASGEGDVSLGDDLASAAQFREGANPYLTFVTTNSSESVAAAQRLTTTDGVASGTARVVGGNVYTSVAASAAITNTSTETIFDKNFTLLANTLKVGTKVRVKFWGVATATNGTDTLQIRLRIGGVGGTILIQTAAIDVADNDVFAGEFELICRTAGTGGTIVGFGWHAGPDADGATATYSDTLASTAIDTTATQAVVVTAQWGAVATGNSCRLDHLTIDVVG